MEKKTYEEFRNFLEENRDDQLLFPSSGPRWIDYDPCQMGKLLTKHAGITKEDVVIIPFMPMKDKNDVTPGLYVFVRFSDCIYATIIHRNGTFSPIGMDKQDDESRIYTLIIYEMGRFIEAAKRITNDWFGRC